MRSKYQALVGKQRFNYATAAAQECAIPLLPEGVRIEDRRPVKEMTDRPALLLLAVCPRCCTPYLFITSEKDTSDYSIECRKCRGHT